MKKLLGILLMVFGLLGMSVSYGLPVSDDVVAQCGCGCGKGGKYGPMDEEELEQKGCGCGCGVHDEHVDDGYHQK